MVEQLSEPLNGTDTDWLTRNRDNNAFLDFVCSKHIQAIARRDPSLAAIGSIRAFFVLFVSLSSIRVSPFDLCLACLAIVLREPMELSLRQLEVPRRAHEIYMNRVATDYRVKTNRIGVWKLVSHRKEERAVSWGG